MDRFIEDNNQPIEVVNMPLKSNMDRFIAVRRCRFTIAHELFKIQYG